MPPVLLEVVSKHEDRNLAVPLTAEDFDPGINWPEARTGTASRRLFSSRRFSSTSSRSFYLGLNELPAVRGPFGLGWKETQ